MGIFIIFEGEEASESKIDENKAKVLEDVNKTAKESFDHSFNISMNALRLTLEKHKDLEDDKKQEKKH
ncbi:hypothetical protein [Flavobacterium cerinum]|uniref:Uncharacterized protein n=1 Tax=Flavobacterium cerinum TaxID=2502784 RepID=A0ABY5IQA7_9FLAO|nr:hypothetical protein [Flavobacterium cerinum]UUC44450.1 hypothetical protein NOX80_12495 [Flavobacterium cerinum]